MEDSAVGTRWMNRGDVSSAIRLLHADGGQETERWLNGLLEKPSVMCVVAESGDRIVGVAMYDVARSSKIKVVSFVVDEGERRKGVGTKMMSMLISSLNKKRNKVELSVSEYNLTAQLFLKSVGFKAVSVSRDGTEASEYKFVYKFSEMVGGGA